MDNKIAILESKIEVLEKEKGELINLLCERCDYEGFCDIEEIPCAVKKFKGE